MNNFFESTHNSARFWYCSYRTGTNDFTQKSQHLVRARPMNSCFYNQTTGEDDFV